MHCDHVQLKDQLRTCSTRVKVSIPHDIRDKFPYTLIAKGIKSENNTYWIVMQMYKSQHENPIKKYHWKINTDVMEAITYLAHGFIREYSIN